MRTANQVPSVAILSLGMDLREPQFTLQPPSLGHARGTVQDGAFCQPSLLGQAKHVMKLNFSSGVSESLKHFWQVKVMLGGLTPKEVLLVHTAPAFC